MQSLLDFWMDSASKVPIWICVLIIFVTASVFPFVQVSLSFSTSVQRLIRCQTKSENTNDWRAIKIKQEVISVGIKDVKFLSVLPVPHEAAIV